jgi:hypothetical protein
MFSIQKRTTTKAERREKKLKEDENGESILIPALAPQAFFPSSFDSP